MFRPSVGDPIYAIPNNRIRLRQRWPSKVFKLISQIFRSRAVSSSWHLALWSWLQVKWPTPYYSLSTSFDCGIRLGRSEQASDNYADRRGLQLLSLIDGQKTRHEHFPPRVLSKRDEQISQGCISYRDVFLSKERGWRRKIPATEELHVRLSFLSYRLFVLRSCFYNLDWKISYRWTYPENRYINKYRS